MHTHTDRQTETDRDRQRQTETDRDRQRQTETDRDRQRQTETDRDRQTDRHTHTHTRSNTFWTADCSLCSLPETAAIVLDADPAPIDQSRRFALFEASILNTKNAHCFVGLTLTVFGKGKLPTKSGAACFIANASAGP